MLGLKLNHVRQKGHGTKKRCKSCFYCTGKKLSFEHVTLATITVSTFLVSYLSWWRHQMETFSALLTICAGNSPVTGEFPAQRPVTRSFDVFFDLRLNKRLSKQSWGWWFETLSRPLWRHYNAFDMPHWTMFLNEDRIGFYFVSGEIPDEDYLTINTI